MERFKRDPQNDADVRLLMQVFPDILPDGRTITHAQLEGALKLSRVSSRYKTVVNKWRKILQAERCVYLDGMIGRGHGFVSLTPDEMVRFSNRTVRASGRKLKKALAVVSMPDDHQLSQDTLKYRGLLQAALEKISVEQRAAIRDVTRALAPMKQLPKRAIGE
ncbi:MAG TPA: hypothetical protein VG538_06085 [Vicinamibacterales bacterium]|jgi:hypothetical protein|nr:hypothetical protein [Vicinamibacterales bacterium]